MPLAVANHLDTEIRIYSSSILTPIINVKPSNWTQDKQYNRIEIAYIAFRRNEHYDATKLVNVHQNTVEVLPENTTRVKRHEMDRHGENNPGNVTPHERADYNSQQKKPSSRKRKKNEAQWKSSLQKKKRLEGKSYQSKTGKTIDGKGVKPTDCSKCRFKCNSKFTEEEKQFIFEMYYALPSYERQRCFI